MADNKMQTRDWFKSRWGFILACIGSAVGMGNIWRFPIMVSTWGGLTFLLPYFLIVVLVCKSGIIEEFAFGRWAQSGPMDAFGKSVESAHSVSTAALAKSMESSGGGFGGGFSGGGGGGFGGGGGGGAF